MSELEQARIDVHHSAEQMAAVQYELDQAYAAVRKWTSERDAIAAQFSEKCRKLAELRANHDS